MTETKLYRVGRFELTLPNDHPLDEYQQRFRLYDMALGDIAQIVAHKYPDATAVDIGANIGDSAALICRDQNMPVLCIEPSPTFLPYLRRNLSLLSAPTMIVPVLVGAQVSFAPIEALQPRSGTASLQIVSDPSITRVPIRPLGDILSEHPRFARPRLLKIDTDGSDFEILLSSVEILRATTPVLYFEYDPTFRIDGCSQAVALIESLLQTGYDRFLVYDNFGNMTELIQHDVVSRFQDLNRYLFSHAFFGRQIYYFDVCAVTRGDHDLINVLLTHRRNVIDQAVAMNVGRHS